MIDCVEVIFEWKKQIPSVERKVFLVGICEDMLILDWDDHEQSFKCLKYVLPGNYSSLSIIIGESGGIYGLLPITIHSLPVQTVSLMLDTSSISNPENRFISIDKQPNFTDKPVNPIRRVDLSKQLVSKKPTNSNLFESRTQNRHLTGNIPDGDIIGHNNANILSLYPKDYESDTEFKESSNKITKQIDDHIDTNQSMREQVFYMDSQVIKLNSMFSNNLYKVEQCSAEIANLHLKLETLIKFKLRHLDAKKDFTNILVPPLENDITRMKEELDDTKCKLRLADEKKEIIIHLATKNIKKYKYVYDLLLNGSDSTEKYQTIPKVVNQSSPSTISQYGKIKLEESFDLVNNYVPKFDPNINYLEFHSDNPEEQLKQVAALSIYLGREKTVVEQLRKELDESRTTLSVNHNWLISLEHVQNKSLCELRMVLGVFEECGILKNDFPLDESDDIFSIIGKKNLGIFNDTNEKLQDFSYKDLQKSKRIMVSEIDLHTPKDSQLVLLTNQNTLLKKRNLELKRELDRRTLNAVRYKKERNQALHDYCKLKLHLGKDVELISIKSQTQKNFDKD